MSLQVRKLEDEGFYSLEEYRKICMHIFSIVGAQTGEPV